MPFCFRLHNSAAIHWRSPQFVNEPRLYLSATASDHTTAGGLGAAAWEKGWHHESSHGRMHACPGNQLSYPPG